MSFWNYFRKHLLHMYHWKILILMGIFQPFEKPCTYLVSSLTVKANNFKKKKFILQAYALKTVDKLYCLLLKLMRCVLKGRNNHSTFSTAMYLVFHWPWINIFKKEVYFLCSWTYVQKFIVCYQNICTTVYWEELFIQDFA